MLCFVANNGKLFWEAMAPIASIWLTVGIQPVSTRNKVKKYDSFEILRVLLSPTRRKKGSRKYRRTARE